MGIQQFPGQFEDENVELVFRRHPVVMRRGFIALLLFVLIGSVVGLIRSRNVTTNSELLSMFFLPVGVGVLFGLAILFYYWIGWYYSVCIVTNRRMIQIQQTGIFKSRSVNDINLSRILSVNYEIKGVVQTVLGFGTIIVQTLVGDFIIKKVGKPAQTQSDIVNAIEKSGVILNEEVHEDIT